MPKLAANTCCTMWCQRLGSCQLKPAHQHSIPLSSSVILFYYVNPTQLVSRWLWSRRRDPLSTQAPIDPGWDAWCWPKTQSLDDDDASEQVQNKYLCMLLRLCCEISFCCFVCFCFFLEFEGKKNHTRKLILICFFWSCQVLKINEFPAWKKKKEGHHLSFLIYIQVGAESDAVRIIWLTGED